MVCCDVCPRVYHETCLPRVRDLPISDTLKEFFCPECTRIADAENTETRIPSMKNVTAIDLATMLRHALNQVGFSEKSLTKTLL